MRIRYNNKICLYFILLLGLGLRIYKLANNSLWGDEAVFIRFRSESGNLIENIKFIWDKFCKEGIGVGIRNYGYGLFTTFWSSLFKGEFMLRLSSVIFGVICIILIYKIGKLLFDKNTGLIAAFILSISPFHIYYSQEFRMYTLIAALTLVSVYCLRRFQLSGSYRFLWGYVLFHVLNFYMNIVTVLVIFAQIVFFMFYLRKYRSLFKKWIFANAAILFFISPAIILITIDLIRSGGIAGVRSSLVTPFLEFGFEKWIPIYTLKNFSAGYNASIPVGVLTLLLFIGLFIWALVKTNNREALYLCLCCLCIPVIFMYAGQRFLYADRYLIPSSFFLYLIVSNGISCLKKPFLLSTSALFSVLTLFSLVNYYRDYLPTPHKQRFAVHEKKANREAADYVLHNFQEGDIIFHTHNHTTLPFEYYINYYFKDKYGMKQPFNNKERIALVLQFFENPRTPTAYKTWSEIRNIMTETTVSVEDHNRVWLVFSAREFKEACSPGSKELRILEWMKSHYNMKNIKYFKGIFLYLFTK